MVVFPPITVRQPRPHDVVDEPVKVCGVGTGFEGVFVARVRANNGRELREILVRAGGTGIRGWRAELGARPRKSDRRNGCYCEQHSSGRDRRRFRVRRIGVGLPARRGGLSVRPDRRAQRVRRMNDLNVERTTR